MGNSKIVKNAFIQAAGVFAYIMGVAFFLFKSKELFGPDGEGGPIQMVGFLLLFVFSAAMMGILVFGQSVLWYLDGKKMEAVKLIFYKIIFIFIFGLAVFTVLFFR